MSASQVRPCASRTRAEGVRPASPAIKGDADAPLNGEQDQPQVRPALDRLTGALVRLAADGGRPHCGDPVDHGLWTSDNEQERALAASWCTGCPVFSACGDAAEAHDERFGVWAGRDRSTPAGRSADWKKDGATKC